MRRAVVAAIVVLACGVVSYWQLSARGSAPQATVPGTPRAPVFDSARAFAHLKAMVEIGPRPAGSAQIRQTRTYISRQIAGFGLTVEEQRFTEQTPKGPIEMVNLIVRLPARRPDRLLFTGHYDTKYMPNQLFVGASDGASSAAFLIELVRVLKDQPRELTYEFIWFDGEEAVVDWNTNSDNTYGSRYYVQAAQKAGTIKSLRAMILVDMIGDRNLQIRRETNSTTWLTEAFWTAAKRVGHGGTFVDAPTTIEDDHLPFLRAGVPSVDIIDLDYTAWHHERECCDDLSRVSARSLQIVGDVVLAALPDIEKRLQRP